jgi:DNA repair photolyase
MNSPLPQEDVTVKQLQRKVAALQATLDAGVALYAMREPVIVSMDPDSEQLAQELTGALLDAVREANPAGHHIVVSQFNRSQHVHVSFTRKLAVLNWNGNRYKLPLDRLLGFWLADGHRIDS